MKNPFDFISAVASSGEREHATQAGDRTEGTNEVAMAIVKPLDNLSVHFLGSCIISSQALNGFGRVKKNS
jgi:hypothetical protein